MRQSRARRVAALLAMLLVAWSGRVAAQVNLDRFNGFESGGAGDYPITAGAPAGDPTARTGQFGLLTSAAAGANSSLTVALSSPSEVFIDRIWACVATSPTPAARRVRAWRSAGVPILELFLLSNGRVNLRLFGNPVGNLPITNCPQFSSIEVEYHAFGSGGSAELRVNGVEQSLSHVVDAAIDTTVIGPDDSVPSATAIIWDDHGLTRAASFPTDLRIAGLLPVKVASFSDWSPDQCSDPVECVSDRPPDGGSSVLFSSTANEEQSFCMESASSQGVFGTILSVKSLIVASAAAPGATIGLALGVNSPACGAEGDLFLSSAAARSLTQAYAGVARLDSSGVGPGGWTEGQVNLTELIIRYVSGTSRANVTQVVREVAFNSTGFPSPTPSRTPTTTRTPTSTSTPTQTETPTHTATPVPSSTPTDTPTPIPTMTPTPEPTDTPMPTATDTPEPTHTQAPTATGTETAPTAAPSNTGTATGTATPILPSNTPTETATHGSPTTTPTETPTGLAADTPTATETPTITITPTETQSPSPTATGPTPTPFPRRGDFIFGETADNVTLCTNNATDDLVFSSRVLPLTTLANEDPEELQGQWLVVYVAPGLHSEDYTRLAQMSQPGGFIDRFVSLGGVAVLNVAGDVDGPNVAPRGVDFVRTPFNANQAFINAPTHGYITGEGYAGDVLEPSTFTLWGPIDQGILSGIPDDATVVLRRQDTSPVWVEYNHGAGRVIVTSMTYCATGPDSRGPALENLLKYSRFFNGLAQTPGLTVTPTNTPTPTATGPTRTPSATRTATSTREPTSTRTGTQIPPTESLPTASPTSTMTPTSEPACVGDCNTDQQVSVSELVTGVNIALDRSAVTTCRALDRDADQRVTVAELIEAVHKLLEGC